MFLLLFIYSYRLLKLYFSATVQYYVQFKYFHFQLQQKYLTTENDPLFETAYGSDDVKHENSPKRMRS